MVYKVSKGGVRTGNTLRGLHSTRTKRYSRHACLMGCTSLGRRDLSRLVTDSGSDGGSTSCPEFDQYEQLVRETLGKTNVLLSLNKQQRWKLPALIGHMIRQGQFHQGAVVSMLEKHKLKRKANCVGLVSNSARNRLIAPKQKKYFSFSLDSVAKEESQRKLRKARADKLKKEKKTKEKPIRASKLSVFDTIETYTSEGKNSKVKPEYTELVDSGKPEYRLEVLYPCPQTCSLTYNPKYTDVTIAEGKTGKMEVKSVVKAPKNKGSTHRKRFTSRDLEDFCCEADEEVVDGEWSRQTKGLTERDNGSQEITNRAYESDFALLLNQAEKARELCVRSKEPYKKKMPRKWKKSFDKDLQQTKSHIVYLQEDNEQSHTPELFEEIPDKTNLENVSNECISNLEHCRVILPSLEMSPDELAQKFGKLYSEDFCSPRRFVLDITEDVSNVLGESKSVLSNTDFSTYLVCVHDGFYDDGLEVFNVTLNSMTGNSTQGLSRVVPFTQTSIPDIMNGVLCHLLDLKEQNVLVYAQGESAVSKPCASDFLTSRSKLKVEVFHPSQDSAIANIEGEKQREIRQSADYHCVPNDFSSNLDEELFCDVCYASVTSSRLDSLPSTKLQQCGHVLCDECWASHFRTCIREGRLRMSCAGYDCGTDVGAVTLLSILSISEVATLLQRQAEERVETMDNAKWCPHPGCGRVIKVDSKRKDLCVDVVCACGNKICFSCFGPAHWPATCEQAEEYLEELPNLKPMKEYVEEEEKPIPVPPPKKKEPMIITVEGRLCPRCGKFIEKNGGCPHMVCKCGYAMCWTCMRSYGHSRCNIDHSWVHQHTRLLVVRHATVRKEIVLPPEDTEETPKIKKNKQRASLYQRALHQRQENSSPAIYDVKNLGKKIVTAASKDSQFKIEILQAFSSDITPNAEEAVWQSTKVSRQVHELLRACVRMKQELHHVTEFTYILLQGMHNSVTKQRILKLANDLSGICSMVRSILEFQDRQSVRAAFRRLVNLQAWAKRALDALINATHEVRASQ